MPKIDIKNLSVTYLNGKNNMVPALTDLNVSFHSGKMNIVIGESGSGKTTLLKAIAQLFNYDGTILFDDVDVSKINNKARNIAYVDQNLFLFANKIVYDILSFPLKEQRVKANEIDQRVKEIAEILEIQDLLTRKPSQLSIGERQKVSIGKTLIKKPSVCLLDEPFSNLDSESKNMAAKYFKKLCQQYEATVILVTHSVEEALMFGDYVYILKNGQMEKELTRDDFMALFYKEGSNE